MKKSELRQLIRETIKEEYNASKTYRDIVYAMSTSNGRFEELVVFSKDQVIDEDKVNNNDVYYFIEKSTGKEYYYIDKIEINH